MEEQYTIRTQWQGVFAPTGTRVKINCWRVTVLYVERDGLSPVVNGVTLNGAGGAGTGYLTFQLGGYMTDGKPVNINDVWTVVSNGRMILIREYLDPSNMAK